MKKFIPILALLFLLACTEKEAKKAPVGTLPKDTMVLVLMDLHVAQAMVSAKKLPPDSARLTYKNKEKVVYGKYQISEKRFNDSYKYYLKDVSSMEGIYQRVVDSLALREAQAQQKN